MLKYGRSARRATAVDRGGVMAYHWTLHIDAPPEKVFDAVSDVEHHSEWANPNAKLSMTSVSGGPPALGSRYRSEQVFAGKPQTADIEIVRFERPGRFAFSVSQRKRGGDGKDVHYTHTFVLTPEGGGTKLVRTTDGDGNRLVGFLAKPAIMKDGRTSLGNLKAKVEASS
jgi:uncharacterized protein YndB with AHSA1/START domain